MKDGYIRSAFMGAGWGAIPGGLIFLASSAEHESDRIELVALAVLIVITCAYVAVFLRGLQDILKFRGPCANTKFRTFFTPALGASAGLLWLAWFSYAWPSGLSFLDGDSISNLVTGSGDLHEQALLLIPKLFVLASVRMFLEHAEQYAAIFAAIAMLGVAILDYLKPKWYVVTFSLGVLAQLIPFIFWANNWLLYGTFDFPAPVSSESILEVTEAGIGLGAILTAFVASVRKGWWSPTTGAWYAARGKERRNFEAKYGHVIKPLSSTAPDTSTPSLIEQTGNEDDPVIRLDETIPIEVPGEA